ncbi:MAG: hypothetical protein COA78_16450 [Blastopirellula sp.]|nr:MAG: hypothetical protein COA78_16450 [Blastopirellula sp.]
MATSLKSIRDDEEELLYEADESELPPSDIVAFNEQRSCADLLRMYQSEQLIIQPDFQRDIVWPNPAQTRFIDSLVKELPIPSMCISFDYNTTERLVIDGLQRMSTIIKFLSDDTWKLSTVSDVDKRISGRTNDYIKKNHSSIYDRIQNLTIPVTVLRCDYKKESHMRYLFTIFHRLNTGGSKLSNQEIRNCIYSGSLNDLLKECVENKDYRHLLNLSAKGTYRFSHEELVLRFFAFTDKFSDYDGKLSSYLNDYMNHHRHADSKFLRKKKKQFLEMIKICYEKLTEGAALPKGSKATTEAIMVGIGRNLSTLRSTRSATVQKRMKELLNTDEFHPDNLKNALTSKDKMISRLRSAVKVLGGK